MATTTFSGPVRSKSGFKVINESTTTGAITETGFSVNATGQLISMGTRKIQSFAGSLAATNAADTAALETLFTNVNTGTEENPVMERPIGHLPTLED
jgi:hypothetical protein